MFRGFSSLRHRMGHLWQAALGVPGRRWRGAGRRRQLRIMIICTSTTASTGTNGGCCGTSQLASALQPVKLYQMLCFSVLPPVCAGEAEGFGAARLARTGAAALALWAHRCSCIVLPLLLLRLGMAPHGSQRLTRVPAEHATMPGAVQSAGGAGGTASQHSGASGGGHGNPLLLVALLALAAATACAAFGERLRTWTAR